MPVTPNPLLDLVPGVGQVANTIQWNVLTRGLEDTGQRLHPFASGSITANTASQVKRNLSGFVLGEVDWRSTNLFTALIQPIWVLEDGSGPLGGWPCGVFMFTDDALHLGTYASTLETTLMDQGYILSQKTKEPFSVAPGGSILVAVASILDQVGVTQRTLPQNDKAIGDPNSWPAGTQRVTILNYLCNAAGWLPGFFDNYGQYVIQVPPDLNTEQPDHTYHGNRVQYGTPVTHANTLTAPNTIVVIGTGPSKGDISAIAYVDPSLPYSVPNRGGLEVVDVRQMQGLTDSAQAQQIANTIAANAPGYQNQLFTGPADPRHDLYQTVEYMDGTVYRELSFTLDTKEGGFMPHVLTLGGWATGS